MRRLDTIMKYATCAHCGGKALIIHVHLAPHADLRHPVPGQPYPICAEGTGQPYHPSPHRGSGRRPSQISRQIRESLDQYFIRIIVAAPGLTTNEIHQQFNLGPSQIHPALKSHTRDTIAKHLRRLHDEGRIARSAFQPARWYPAAFASNPKG